MTDHEAFNKIDGSSSAKLLREEHTKAIQKEAFNKLLALTELNTAQKCLKEFKEERRIKDKKLALAEAQNADLHIEISNYTYQNELLRDQILKLKQTIAKLTAGEKLNEL